MSVLMLKTMFLNNFHLKSLSDRNAKKCWCSSIRNCTWSTTPGQGTSHSCVCRKISACHRWRGRWWWWWWCCWRWSWLLLLFDLSLKITNHLFVVTIVFQMFLGTWNDGYVGGVPFLCFCSPSNFNAWKDQNMFDLY